jgi:hypothetical protein
MEPVVSEYSITPPPGTPCRRSILAATVDPMRGYWARGQPWAFVYLAVRRLFDLFLLSFRSEESKEIELLTLRHEVEVLRVRLHVLPTSPPIMPCWQSSIAAPPFALGRLRHYAGHTALLAPPVGHQTLDVPSSATGPPTS